MEQLKREPAGRDIWICGGADTAAQLIRKNAIDRYVVSVIPVILGEGIPLFSRGAAPAGPASGLRRPQQRDRRAGL